MNRTHFRVISHVFVGLTFLSGINGVADVGGSREPYPESRFGSPPVRRSLLDIEAQEQESRDRTQKFKEDTALRSEGERSESLRSYVGAHSPVQEIAVIASDLGFFPSTLFVTRDIPVRLFVTGASKDSLCVMQDDYKVRKQIRSQKITEISFTPSKVGRFRFYCPINGMEGVLFVKEYKD